MQPRLCLNMIVKNEGERILRALKSAAPHIACYAIVDTGSSDGTVQKIAQFFEGLGIPGKVDHATFKNFAQARNEGIQAAFSLGVPWDYALLMDADMELKVLSPDWLVGVRGPSVDMFQVAGTTHYANRRLLSRDVSNAKYVGVTHEYLDVGASGCIPQSQAYFYDHSDGSNRNDKWKRDVDLLLEGLKDEPNNERYFFYLANSYRDGGMFKEAAEWYRKRVAAGGWDEEVWAAQNYLAHTLESMGDETGFVYEMIKAFNLRPSRAESLYDLSKFYREKKNMNDAAVLFSRPALEIPRPNDVLFVNDFVYDVGIKEEFSIAGFYTKHKNDAFWIAHRLAIQPTQYTGNRDLARANLYHYLPKAEDLFKSFKWRKIEIPLDDHWCALNPSVTTFENKLVTTVRTVNYKMDYEGRYWIRATDGSANQENPINTRNFLVQLDSDLLVKGSEEIHNPTPFPVEYPLVIGFEDPRLFVWKDQLWTSSTVRQLNREGYCEQVLARIGRSDQTFEAQFKDVKRMLRTPRQTEKNWMPVVAGDKLSFMYKPGELVDAHGQTYQKTDLPFATDSFGGGTQLIEINGGWLGLIHEARVIPGRTRRYYQHRFVFYDRDFKNLRPSRPFVFHDREIEYAAGITLHPTLANKVVISYGYQDNEARICQLDVDEIAEWIWGTPA